MAISTAEPALCVRRSQEAGGGRALAPASPIPLHCDPRQGMLSPSEGGVGGEPFLCYGRRVVSELTAPYHLSPRLDHD